MIATCNWPIAPISEQHMITPITPEDFRALEDLRAPAGQPGSGRIRYAAAMHFNRSNRLSDGALEVFRICSPLDHEDPTGLLLREGIWPRSKALPYRHRSFPSAS